MQRRLCEGIGCAEQCVAGEVSTVARSFPRQIGYGGTL
jgi:hypothetical protein